MAVQYNSLISGKLQILTWQNLENDMFFLVFAYAALLVLAIVAGCKAYVYVMVGLLKKLPDEPSSDPLHLVIVFSILLRIFTHFEYSGLWSEHEHSCWKCG